MTARFRKFRFSPLAALPVLALSVLIALPMRMLEPDYGLPLLYAVRGERQAPQEAVVIGLDKAGVDWLTFHADRLDKDAPELDACLPASVRAELARASNVEDLPRGLIGCLLLALAELAPRAAVIDIHFYGTTDETNDGLLEEGLRRLRRPILLEKVQASSLGGPAMRERPAARFREAAQTGAFVVEWRDGDTYRYVAAQPDFPLLRSFPRLAAEAAGLPPLPPGEREPPFSLFNLYGPAGAIETVSFLDILTGRYRKSLGGRVVFVGASHPKGIARRDDFETAWSSSGGGDLAGVELAATGFLNLLLGNPLRRLPPAGEVAMAAAVGFAMLTTAITVSAVWGAVAALALGGLYFAGATVMFSLGGLWLPVASVFYAFAPLAVLLAVGVGYRHTSAVLYRLLPRTIAAALVQDHSRTRSPAVVTEATVLVIDLIGSSALAEKMEEAAFNRRMTEFFNLLNGAVEAGGGMVLKYTGDGLLAVFDSADLGGSHATRALGAAVNIARALESQAESGTTLSVRIGVNSGMIAVGEVGADTRSSIDAMGDAVNIAARLEQMGRDLEDSQSEDDSKQTTILVAEFTILLSKNWLPFAFPIGWKNIRGRQGDVRVYRINWQACGNM